MDFATIASSLPFFICMLMVSMTTTSTQFLTECERGVKRSHPTQENVFQIFIRSDAGSKWIDQMCPAPQIFESMKCECSTPSPELPKALPTSSPPVEDNKGPWFSRPTYKKLRKAGADGKPVQRKKPTPPTPPPPPPPPPPPSQSQRNASVMSNEADSSWQVQTQEKAPVTGVAECKFHRPRAEDPGQYEQWTEWGWMFADCNWPVNSGLVWNQQLCRCDWGPHRILPQRDPNSVPAVCLLMLKMTFDDGVVKDAGRDLWLDFRHPYNIEAVRDKEAVGGWTGAFRGAGFSVPFFKMNTLGSTFRIKFRFKLCDGQPDADLMIINNGCVESDALPSIQVTYRAWTRVLAFQMATLNSKGPFREECHIPNPDSWIDVNIHYDQDVLEIVANGNQCVRSTAYSGPIVQTDCPLVLLEDNFCGLLDEVMITRGCTPSHES